MLRQPATEHTRRISVVYNPENLQTSNTAEFLTRKKRVAAYARVSTLQDEQQNSYEAQINYYTGYIQARPEWEFVGIYADEGITGTNTKHRKEFNRMIEDTVDFLTKEVRVNNGERKQWYIHDSHDAIVTPETFELVQIELKRRTGRKGKFYDSPFTGKIVCGDCGAFYGHRVWHSNNKYRRNIWLCNDKYDNGVKCLPPRVTEEEIKAALLNMGSRNRSSHTECGTQF